MCYMFDAEVNGIACLKCGPVKHLSECTTIQECDSTQVFKTLLKQYSDIVLKTR